MWCLRVVAGLRHITDCKFRPHPIHSQSRMTVDEYFQRCPLDRNDVVIRRGTVLHGNTANARAVVKWVMLDKVVLRLLSIDGKERDGLYFLEKEKLTSPVTFWHVKG
jgi:hypothetical protein